MSEEGAEDFAAMLAALRTASSRLQPGQKVTGTVIAITGDSVFVDVGIKVDGIIDRKDILDAEGNEKALNTAIASKRGLRAFLRKKFAFPAP